MEADGVIAPDEPVVSGATEGEYKFATSEALLIYLAAAVLVIAAVLWTANGPRLEKIDFSVTYLGARMVHDGRGAQLYDLTEQIKLR